jgi:magnesium chelatase accessory protein
MYERFYPEMNWAAHSAHWPLAGCSAFVQADGIRWHVQRMGQGPVILLLHGTGSGSFSWRALMPTLAEGFTVVAPDLPGHVFTSRGGEGALSLLGMSRGVSALLRALNLTPTAIVGHSAGAAIAAQMALDDSVLAQAVLIGLNPAWLPLPGLAGTIFGPAAKLAALNPLSAWITAKLASKEGVVAQWLSRTGSTLDAEGLSLYTRVLSDAGHVHGVLSMMAAWRLQPLAERLHQLRNPVRIAIGEKDQTVPPALAQQACHRLPQAQLWVQPGLGHLAHEQDPLGTAAQILQWCRPGTHPG